MKADSIIIEGDENYTKQTYRNRCEICTGNGKLILTIPVIKTNGNHTKIKDIRIDYSVNWQLKHWRAIVSAYNHSPYFLFYRDALEPFYIKNYKFLFDYNSLVLNMILRVLNAQKSIEYNNSYLKKALPGMVDLRYDIIPKNKSNLNSKPYWQVFNTQTGFIPNMSVIDLIFNLGMDSKDFLFSQ
jgi:hypothetical protein